MKEDYGFLYRKVILIIIALALFIFGGYIYITFRPTSLRMFSWFDNINIMNIIEMIRLNPLFETNSRFIIYSLPNGLWATSYFLIMDAIWMSNLKLQILYSSIMPIVGITSELLQKVGILKGTYDTRDLICYTLPYIVYILLKIKTK